MPKVLIIDLMHESIIPLLTEAGFEVDYEPEISVSAIPLKLHAYEGLIIRSKIKVDQQLIAAGHNLRFIARAGAGLDTIDEDFLKARNISLLNAPEGNRTAVGEHALGLLLCLFNKINLANQEVKNYTWRREANRGYEIAGKTIGIIGYGHMGKSFAKCLSGFSCNVLAYDKYLTQYGDHYASEASLDTIYKEADVLSLHIPLTSVSRNWLNTEIIHQFHKPIWLINTARGEIVPLKTVVEGLQSGKILGAGLDVLPNEQFHTYNAEEKEDFNTLINANQVVLTPHVAGWTHESYVKINQVLVQKINSLYKHTQTI